MTREQKFTQFRRKQIAELRPYVPGDDLEGVSVAPADTIAGSPKLGDMIARNPKNHEDLWLVAAQYFSDNFEPVPALTAGEEAGGVKVKALEWKRYRNGDAYAVTPFGDVYTAYAGGYWRITKQGKAGKFIRAGFDVASAQAAAQADYENSVLSVIEPTPSPIVDDAMVERAAKPIYQTICEALRDFGIAEDVVANDPEVASSAHITAVAVLNAALSGAREGGGNALD
ncbi:hypothetical protein NA8A_04703 [Nitratireductor indicus C115]|uniref:Uncharacterized protein n=1 Tax=Nitratireductor indicus C115 TaxID=1231190 RepID=K2PQH7_9HYPH|nr:hypothetical protein [Nitratireductor indicus]EKF43302.1 hypothetical protein NA8A_04703 [Nitratireductor indicus C115]SFQ10552.1 hypothetical protein SAMN05216176_101367 [Nitratireductor indicus]